MEWSNIIQNVLSALIGFGLGFYLFVLRESYKEKHQRMNERYLNLYLPFEKLILKETHGAFHFHDLPADTRQKFIDLIYENYHYAGSKLKLLMTEFRWTVIEFEKEPMEYEDMDIHFHMLCR